MIPPNPITAIQQKIHELLPELETLEGDFYAGDPIKPKLSAAVDAMRKMRKVIANPFAKQPEVPSAPDRAGENLARAGERLCDLLESTGFGSDSSPNSAAWRGALGDMRAILQRIEHEAEKTPAAPTISPKNGVSQPARRQHTATAGLC